MRLMHNSKRIHAVGSGQPRCYLAAMHFTRLRTFLRATSLVILLAVFTLWLSTGRHTGWTQTSVVELRHDDITGINYPVRREALVAGVDLLAAGAAAAGLLAGLSLIPFRRRLAMA
jgi:hypothetical protein